VSYVDKHLQPGETVVYRTTVTWLVYLPAVVFLVLAVAAYVAIAWLAPAEDAAQARVVAPLAGGLFLAVAAIAWLKGFLRRLSTELAVTDRRVITKVGLIRRTTMEMNLSKVESVVVDQGVLGRLLDYGTVIVKGTGGGLEPLSMIDGPLEFRSRITAG
jgi:uncharacterized membrane protein YdbT with pleckstrin-like domain